MFEEVAGPGLLPTLLSPFPVLNFIPPLGRELTAEDGTRAPAGPGAGPRASQVQPPDPIGGLGAACSQPVCGRQKVKKDLTDPGPVSFHGDGGLSEQWCSSLGYAVRSQGPGGQGELEGNRFADPQLPPKNGHLTIALPSVDGRSEAQAPCKDFTQTFGVTIEGPLESSE